MRKAKPVIEKNEQEMKDGINEEKEEMNKEKREEQEKK